MVTFHSFFPNKVLILLTLSMYLFAEPDFYNLMLLEVFGIKLLTWKAIKKHCKYFWFTKTLFPLDSSFKSDTRRVSRILDPTVLLLWIVNIVKKLFIIDSNIKTCLNHESMVTGNHQVKTFVRYRTLLCICIYYQVLSF